MITTLRKRKKLLILLLIVGIVVIAFIFHPSNRPSSFHSYNQFSIGIRLEGGIRNGSNATFLLPLPMHDGSPRIGTRVLTDEYFAREGMTTSLIGENGGVYLKVVIPPLAATAPDIYHAGEINISFPDTDSEFKPMDTRHPVGNEPVFLPKNNLTSQKPGSEFSLAWYGFHYNPVTSRYQIPVYAEYMAAEGSTIKIYGSIHGFNQWAELATYFTNSYRDRYRLTLNESAGGWYLAEGEMESGEGKYLEISDLCFPALEEEPEKK